MPLILMTLSFLMRDSPKSQIFSTLCSSIYRLLLLQPIPGKMRLEMVIGMDTKILDGHPRSCFERFI